MITRLKWTPGIYLVGFMGSGKTTVGRLLADRLGWPFVDLDDEVEASQGRKIAEIFESHGETEFRRLECEALKARVRDVECGRPLVLALGGGAFVQQAVFELLENNGVTIWLDCPFEPIKRRVENQTHRPLARDPEKFAALFEERKAAYGRADYRVAIENDDPAAAVDAVFGLKIL